MKAILIICLAATQLVLGRATDSICSNMWQADFNNPDVSICPVGTFQKDRSERTGECQFPFTHGGQTYKHCILGINGLQSYPSCKTTAGKFEKCIVDIDAIVYGVTTRKAGSFKTNGASIKGGTMLWITGLRFAENSFSTSPSAETSNVVYLTNDFSSYPCDIHSDATTKTQITCFTPEMNPGRYLVQVSVKGNHIPAYQYTNNQVDAYIEVNSASTPYIKSIEPTTGVPGSFVTIKGSFKTHCFLRDTDGCADDSGARITRVYVGGQQCQLIDPKTNELYKEVSSSSIFCRLDKPEIGYFRASMLVTNEYGRSEANRAMSFVSPDENIYHFQTFAEVDDITPRTGSNLGGTRITITGKYLYTDDNVPAMIEVSGEPCKVIDFEMNNLTETKIVCETAAKSGNNFQGHYGNRGLTVLTMPSENSLVDLGQVSVSDDSVIKFINEADYEAASGKTMWFRGYLYPRKNSSYEFSLSTSGVAVLYIGTGVSALSRNEVANSNTNKGTVDLQADTYYYFEAIASSENNGKCNLKVTGKMLDTDLTDKDSASVLNEKQQVEITSSVSLEGYKITFTETPTTSSSLINGTSASTTNEILATETTDSSDETFADQTTSPSGSDKPEAGTIQEFSVQSKTGAVPFVLSLFGASTRMLEFGVDAKYVTEALNDMPMMYPNLANVTDASQPGSDFKTYRVEFSTDLGNVPHLQESMNFVQFNLTRISEATKPGKKSYLLINDQPSALFDLDSSEADIKKAVDQSFGIRCPTSIQSKEDKDVHTVWDFEGCNPGVNMINETAFCGKCAKQTHYLMQNSEAKMNHKFLCFAYKTSNKVSYVVLDIIDPLWNRQKSIWSRIDLKNDNQWHYDCLDIAETYLATKPKENFPMDTIVVKNVWVHPRPSDLVIDAVSVRKTRSFDVNLFNMDVFSAQRMIPTLQYHHGTFELTKSQSTVEFKFRPTNCSFNLKEFQLTTSSGTQNPLLARSTRASPPVTGSFSLSWDSNDLKDIPADITEDDMSALLQSMPNFGNVVVTRSQDCSGYKWEIKWLDGGNKPPLTILGSALSGDGVAVIINLLQDGGALFSPLNSDMLRTWHFAKDSQVAVSINEIPSKCSNCSFKYTNEATPSVNSIDASNLAAILISGTGFDPEPAGNLVMLGDVKCTVSQASTTQLTCSAGENSIGTYSFIVNVLSKGLAAMNATTTATFALTATAISPVKGSTGGGNLLTINGTGFSAETAVTVDGAECKVKTSSYSLITCVVPMNPTLVNKNVDIVVSQNGVDSTLSAAYLYDFNSTPEVTSISPDVLSVKGNEIVTFQGTNLPTFSSGVIISGIQLKIVSSNSTHLVARSPSIEPGLYDLILETPFGFAKINKKIEYKLFVTSFTPSVGSLRGGSFVNIAGGGFSQECQENKVSFDKQPCTVLNCTETSIQCETTNAYVNHVVTNQGADPYHGKGYAWSIPFLKATVGDSVTWKWHPPTGISTVSFRVLQVDDAASYTTNGFDSGDAKATGRFTYQFTKPGVYHYWSGYVESSKQIKFRGVVEVNDAANINKELQLNVQLNDKKAQQCHFPFTYKNIEYTSCTYEDEAFSWCSPSFNFTGQKLKCSINSNASSCPGEELTSTNCADINLKPFQMLFSNCKGTFPKVTSVSVTNATFDTDIVIKGTGFGSTQCQNEVRIGKHICQVTQSSVTQITCQIGPDSGLYANYNYPVEVLIKNIGFAIQEATNTIKFMPKVTSFTPSVGSMAGGLAIQVNGDGFLNAATLVVIGNRPYYENKGLNLKNFTNLEVVTVSKQEEATEQFKVLVNNIQAECINCSFIYSNAATSGLDSISPSVVNSSAEITISGRYGNDDKSEYTVMIGDVPCDVKFVNFTAIICDIAGVRAGDQTVHVNIRNKGNTIHQSKISIRGELSVSNVTPKVGSIRGGSLVTVKGNGFSKYTQVSFGSYPCIVKRATVNELECVTTDSTKTPIKPTKPITTTTTEQPSTTQSTTKSADPCLVDYRAAMLKAHNEFRALHNVTDLVDNDEIDTVAQKYAEVLAENDLWEHSKGSGYGENLAKSWSSQVSSLTNCAQYGAKYAKMWYDEIAFYDFNNPGEKLAGKESEAIGHFTQVVWKKSTQLGCGIAISNTKFIYGVCNYSPPGNYIGKYGENVLPLSNSRRRRSVDDILQSLQITNFGNVLTSDIVGFTYSESASPIITSVSPSSGTGGLITISGRNFGNSSNVTVGKIPCDVTEATATEIKCNLKAGPAGDREIMITDKFSGDSNSDVVYTFPLEIGALSKIEGSVGGGLELTITGSGYQEGTKVKICGNECTIRISSVNSIVCKVPAADQKDKDTPCDVEVIENGLKATSTFTYKVSLTPKVLSSSPNRGGTGGGTLVTINGSGFPLDSKLVKVTIAKSPCLILSISESVITCHTEPYKFSSIKAKIMVDIVGSGLALNDDAEFEYIDLWSSKFTWGGLAPPGEGELAVIGPNQHIHFDAVTTPILKGIIIQGGSLIFDDNQDVSLNVEYVIINGGGKLQVGTKERPFEHKATITMFGHTRSVELPIYGAKVIAVRNGTLDLHGKPVGVTWTHLGETAAAGSNQIVLKEPVKWEIGSEIVIATTGDKFSPGESELAFVTAKSGDNKTLTIDKALKFEHLGVTRKVGSGANEKSLEVRAEVGLLTRNVKFQGHNDNSWNRLKSSEGCPKGFNPAEFAVQTCFLGRYGPELGSDEFGGIIFIHGGQDQPKDKETVIARISNVELYHVGQAFKLGRYPIHFHLNGDMPSSYVQETTIHESFNRAINIHGSNYLQLTRNVIYNIMGGAYFLEDGVEIGNRFLFNLAVFVRTSSSLLNEDVTPAAFWATNPNNTYMHNAVAGSTHFGWWYRILDHPEGPSYRPDYCPKKIPFGRHFNNSVHSTGRFGIWVFPGYMPTVSGSCGDSRPSAALFEDFTSWSNDKGAEWVNSNNIQLKKLKIWDQLDTGIDVKIIKGNSNANTGFKSTFYNEDIGPTISDSFIVGNSQGGASIGRSGITLAWDRGQLVKNVQFYNYPSEGSSAFSVTSINGVCKSKCGGWTNKVTGLFFDNVKYRHMQRWEWDNVLYDMDGSLTGKADNIVVFKDSMSTAKANCKVPEPNLFKNGIVCSESNTQIRFAFNKFNPEAATILKVTDSANMTEEVEKLKKRLTHKFGYMMHLEAKNEYLMVFRNAERVTNMSYISTFYDLAPGDWLIIRHNLLKKPDELRIGGKLLNEIESVLDPINNAHGDWHWDNSTYSVSYLVKNVNTKPFLDIPNSFSAIKCRYTGCKPPESPGYRAPIAGRPENAVKWSDLATWGSDTVLESSSRRKKRSLPADGDSIRIPDGVYVVVDVPLPKLKVLEIQGYLELDNSMNHYLEANMIFINGGQLIAGWENDPILTNVSIVLTGEKDSLDFRLPNGLDKIGGKGIGCYGGLDLHGKPRDVIWTTLTKTAKVGHNQVVLKDSVDWVAGEQIIVTTTAFVIEQSEAMTIKSVSQDKKTLTLTTSFGYDHIVTEETFANGQGYKIAAAVGLLTRNVKVIGQEYAKQQDDLYGFRIVVSDYSAVVYDYLAYYKGYARVSNTEFVHPGQFDRTSGDDVKVGILFSNLAAFNESRSSYVRNSAFHHGLGTALSLIGSDGILIENNVLHKTLDYSIRCEGKENKIIGNLITVNHWGATFLGAKEQELDKTYWGAIDISGADSAIVENNLIAGVERTGLNQRGDVCDGDKFPGGLKHSIKNNTIHGAGAGVVIDPTFSFDFKCVKISGFTVFKSQYYGIYYQSGGEVVIENNVMVDNQMTVFTIVFGPSPLSHEPANKKTIQRNSLMVGHSAAHDCEKDVKPTNASDANQLYATFGARNNNARIGMVFPTNIASKNGIPGKPWTNIMSYNTIGGLMVVKNVTFANFGEYCGTESTVIATSIKNDDGQHPVTMSEIYLFNVTNSSKIFFHRPNVGLINPSDCVDMDCDGLKKNLITDEDGSFLGKPGAVIAQSEFEWGSQQRGLGEFRIPKEMLAYPNGSMIEPKLVYNHPGIVRDEKLCSYIDAWQAHECYDMNYKMLIIESMDKETEDRRLSPVAILSDNKYLDLINGPQDHGWCFGYTCQKRISTFMAIVASNKTYDIVLTSTPPQKLRFRILNSDDTFKVILSMHYTSPQRIDLYNDNKFIDPKNAEYVDGAMQIKKPSQSDMPTMADTTGTNVFLKEKQKIYFTKSGLGFIDLKIAPVLFVSFGLPAITPDEFFNEATIVGNFAKLLGVDPSKIRRVEIVRASSRRKRDANAQNIIKIIIEENATPDSSDEGAADKQKAEMDKLDASISNMFMTNQLQEKAASLLNVTLTTMVVQKPASAEEPKAVPKKIVLEVETKASGCNSQVPCTVQPVIKVVDENGDLVKDMGNANFPWIVVANMTQSSSNTATLLNQTEMNIVDGYATFTKLGISEITEFGLSFSFKTPEGVDDSKFDPQVQPPVVLKSEKPTLTCLQDTNEISVEQDTQFTLDFTVVDKTTKTKVADIKKLANVAWTAKLTLYPLGYFKANGQLSLDNSTAEFDTTTGDVSFKNIAISEAGMYLLTLNVNTSDASYKFDCFSKTIEIIRKGETLESYDANLPPNYVFKYEGDFDKIEPAEVKANMYNYMSSYNITARNIEAVAGSVYITFYSSGSNSDLINSLIAAGVSIDPNLVYSYASINDNVVNCTNCVIVETTTETPVIVGSIVGGVIGAVAASAIILIGLFGYKEFKKVKVRNTTVDPNEQVDQETKGAKAKAQKMLKKMTGTTTNYQAMGKLPDIYNKSYLERSSTPEPTLPDQQRYN